MLKNLSNPAKYFLYLAILSVVVYLIQSASFLHVGLLKVLVSKIILIAIWTYIVNKVAKDGQGSSTAAWLLGLWAFIPSSLGIFI